MRVFAFVLIISIIAVGITYFSRQQVPPSLAPSPQPSAIPSSTPVPLPTLIPTPVTTATPSPAGVVTNGWKLTVYYTPVEKYHGGEEEHVPGVGSMSSEFLEILRLEGVGKISKGPHAGKYLHYTDALGYWLTETPLDAQGKTLVKLKTMAAPQNIKFGTKVKIIDCGHISNTACNQISAANWIVTDRFGDDPEEKHLDLYIGEEDRENFLKTHPLIFITDNATVNLY